MVRIFFEKEEGEEKDPERYVDVNIWSLVKSTLLSNLLIYAICFGIFWAIVLIFRLFTI